MLKFADVFKKSFLEGYTSIDLSTGGILAVFLITTIVALYIFFCYRLFTRHTFYSRSFNISLVAMTVLTAAVILTIQSSVVVSLGMVGALSIVRFRTAIKDPMDLIFLFWSISAGIICGAGLSEIAILASLVVTVLLLVLDRFPVARAPMILVIHAESSEASGKIRQVLDGELQHYSEKSRAVTGGQLDLVYEIRVKNGEKLVEQLSSTPGVTSVSLLRHDGEVTF